MNDDGEKHQASNTQAPENIQIPNTKPGSLGSLADGEVFGSEMGMGCKVGGVDGIGSGSVPVGGSPTGAGESPALPGMEMSEYLTFWGMNHTLRHGGKTVRRPVRTENDYEWQSFDER
jgi:hypothetical protein